MIAANKSEDSDILVTLFKRSPISSLGLSFALTIGLMIALILLSLNRLDTMHTELENIVTQHNEKIELVHTMRFIVRERMIAMLQLVIEDDPFKRDEITQHFMGQATHFVEARNQLKKMAQTREELSLFEDLQKLTVIGTPFQDGVVDLLLKDDMIGARNLLKDKAIPAQLNVVNQCDAILAHYKQVAREVEIKTHATHDKTTFLLKILGGVAAGISLLTAITVLKLAKKDRDELQQAHSRLEEKVAQRTKELQLSVEQLAEAQQISHLGHWEWHLDNNSMNWSDEVFRIFGHTPQSFQPTFDTLLGIIVPADQRKMKAAIDKVILDQAPFDFEYRVVQPNGSIRHVRQQASVKPDPHGKLLKILGTIQDVTENKAAEQELRLAASVFENAGEGIIICDADNNIVNVNSAFTEVTGFTHKEAVGQNPRIFKSGKHDPSFYREMWNTLLGTGSWRGELWGRRKSGAIYPKWQSISTICDDKGRITNFLAIFRDISDSKKHEENLWHLAHFDNLCGVANRSLMYANLRQALAHARREKHLVALMLFDLDHFKTINDTQGHDAGDQLLVHVANQLKASVRECDTVARLGGDEFTVILTKIHRSEDVQMVVQNIQKALGSSLTLKNGETIVVSASIGIALFPDDAGEIELLMKCADQAMYLAKELGRNNAQFYRAGLSQETRPESPVT